MKNLTVMWVILVISGIGMILGSTYRIISVNDVVAAGPFWMVIMIGISVLVVGLYGLSDKHEGD